MALGFFASVFAEGIYEIFQSAKVVTYVVV
jgi:hypothetical protein